MFKRHWFTRVVEHAPEGLRWARYWDLAASTKTSADFTASAAVAVDDEGVLYIRDMIRGRWEWPDAKKTIKTAMLAENGTHHGIEEKMHGLAAMQELRRDPELLRVNFSGQQVDTDKVSRALPWAARAEAGRVVLVKGDWIAEFLAEVCSFPNAAHDDQVDTISGGVQMLTAKRRMRVA